MTYSLFLFEQESNYSPEKLEALKTRLLSIGLIQPDSDNAKTQPGVNLMEYINYLGCSPALTTGSLEARITLRAYENLTGLGGESIEALRYPGCKHVIQPEDIRPLLSTGGPDQTWTCPNCGQKGRLKDINWRKSAGFSHYFIEISPIFPKEALPTDALLDALQQVSQRPWSWFYSVSST